MSSTEPDNENYDIRNPTVDNQINDTRKQNENELSENSQAVSSSMPTTQDLLNICSGEFSGISQISEPLLKHDSIAPNNNLETITLKEKENERKSLDIEHDVIISQLLDEDEMENFKKKFDSPGTSNTQKTPDDNKLELEDIHVTGVLDSDDDEEDEMKIKRKKNKSKLTFSGTLKRKILTELSGYRSEITIGIIYFDVSSSLGAISSVELGDDFYKFFPILEFS